MEENLIINRNRTINIGPVIRENRFGFPKEHQTTFLMDGCTEKYEMCAASYPLRNLSKAKKDEIENAIAKEWGVDVRQVSPLAPDSIWNQEVLVLQNGVLSLDLNNVRSYTKYLIAKSYEKSGKFVEGKANISNSPIARWVIYDDHDTTGQVSNRSVTKKNVMGTLIKYEENIERLRDILILYNKKFEPSNKIGRNCTSEFVKDKLATLADEDPLRLNSIMESETFQTELLVISCLDKGIISKKGNSYWVDFLDTPLANNQEDLIEYLLNPDNDLTVKKIVNIMEGFDADILNRGLKPKKRS